MKTPSLNLQSPCSHSLNVPVTSPSQPPPKCMLWNLMEASSLYFLPAFTSLPASLHCLISELHPLDCSFATVHNPINLPNLTAKLQPWITQLATPTVLTGHLVLLENALFPIYPKLFMISCYVFYQAI